MLNKIIYVNDENIQGPWDGSEEHPFQHIQNAIDAASNGDIIFVYSGIYYENIIVNKSLCLVGENRNTTIIDGGSNNSFILITRREIQKNKNLNKLISSQLFG